MAESRVAPRWRKLLRDLRVHRARALLVVLAVAVALTAAGAVLDTWALVRGVTRDVYLASHPAAATLRLEHAPDAAALEELRALPALAAVRVRSRSGGVLLHGGARYPLDLYAREDYAARDIAALEPQKGAWPPLDGAIAIEQSSLDFAGLALGDTVEVSIADAAPQALTVAATVRDVGQPPGWMDHVVYAFVTPATFARLAAGPASELQFTLRDADQDRAAIRRVADDVAARLQRRGVGVRSVTVPPPGQHPHAAQMQSLLVTQGGFGALTLLVASFLIVNLLSAVLASQAREIAVMKALGAGGRQIATLYFTFAAGLGFAAALCALRLAYALARPYAAMQAQMLNFPSDAFVLPAWVPLLQLAVGTLLPLAAAAWPVARATRVSVAAALRDPGVAAAHGAYIARRIALPGIGRPLTLALANAFRRRQRTLLTLLALAAGGAVFLGAANLRRAVTDAVDAMFAPQKYDVVLRLAEARPPAELRDAALAVDGVSGAEAFANERASVLHADGTHSDRLTLLGIPPGTPLLAPQLAQGRWFAPDDTRALVVSSNLLKDEPQLVPGATVELELDGRHATWHVVGVDTGVIQSMAYAPAAALAEWKGDANAGMLAVALRGDAAAKLDVIARLRAALEQRGWHVAGSQSVADARRSLEDHLRMVGEFLGAMGWVMLLVGAMGLGSSMSLAVLERTRELGVLRAIGAPHGALWRIVLAESVAIALLAWFAALPLSVPISAWLADAFGRVMFELPVRALPTASATLSWLLLVLAVALAASAWPARRALRLRIATALAYE